MKPALFFYLWRRYWLAWGVFWYVYDIYFASDLFSIILQSFLIAYMGAHILNEV